ncbi:MAG TPA: aromatic ring-hydroxylating dioxygenase subunit alpha [Pseudomonadota bacterium]|nr:aromatic ring-hydroxylating dioxygenase subunit alpha [Pseudomonadota bacterium]
MLKNFWYAIELSTAIGPNPSKVRVLGQDLALYRARSGRVVALSNVCIHRGGSLADGSVDTLAASGPAGASDDRDCLRCPYHGWAFRPDGSCAEIPASPPDLPVPKRARVDSYPTVERYGFVWVFLGDLPENERPPIPALPEFDDSSFRPLWGEFMWNAHYSRVVENGLDISHTPFVHQASFGNREQPQIPEYEVQHGDWSAAGSVVLTAPRPRGLWGLIQKKRRNEVRASVAVYMPHITRLDLQLGNGWRTIVYDANVPVDDGTTRTLWLQLRNFFRAGWADGDATRRMLQIFEEDAPIVEAQQPPRLPYELGAELHVKSDALAVAYRKLRKRAFDAGWGIDTDTIARECSGRREVVIPSPSRRARPDLAKAWVFSEVPTLPAREPASAAGDPSRDSD